MNTLKQVMTELKKRGKAQTRKIYARHGIPEDTFGVSIADLKTIAKKIKGNQSLAYELYDSGNYDAMYLAGIVADGSLMTKKQLESWVKNTTCGMISQYTIPSVACENSHARSLAMKWIRSRTELIACSGWCTYAGVLATRHDEDLDLLEIKTLLNHIKKEISDAPNLVRYTMNGFVIAVGSYVKPLLKQAKQAAKTIGVVSVDMGETACKVPLASAYIEKIETAGRVGKKRKSVKC